MKTTLTLIEMIEQLFLRLVNFVEHKIKGRERFIDRKGDAMQEKARTPVELVRFDMLEPGKKYDTAGFVKIYKERLFEKKPDEIMSMIEGAASFRGRFEVLDLDGGIEDIPLWYEVKIVKSIFHGEQIESGWVNSLSFRKTKVRAAVHN